MSAKFAALIGDFIFSGTKSTSANHGLSTAGTDRVSCFRIVDITHIDKS